MNPDLLTKIQCSCSTPHAGLVLVRIQPCCHTHIRHLFHTSCTTSFKARCGCPPLLPPPSAAAPLTVIPEAINAIYTRIASARDCEFSVRVSFVEIHKVGTARSVACA